MILMIWSHSNVAVCFAYLLWNEVFDSSRRSYTKEKATVTSETALSTDTISSGRNLTSVRDLSQAIALRGLQFDASGKQMNSFPVGHTVRCSGSVTAEGQQMNSFPVGHTVRSSGSVEKKNCRCTAHRAVGLSAHVKHHSADLIISFQVHLCLHSSWLSRAGQKDEDGAVPCFLAICFYDETPVFSWVPQIALFWHCRRKIRTADAQPSLWS